MRLAWTAPALSDLRRIGDYLTREAHPDVAVRILSLIRDRSTRLAEFPFAGPKLPDRDIRSLRVHGSPYIIVYRAAGETIEILRISHERENWRAQS